MEPRFVGLIEIVAVILAVDLDDGFQGARLIRADVSFHSGIVSRECRTDVGRLWINLGILDRRPDVDTIGT